MKGGVVDEEFEDENGEDSGEGGRIYEATPSECPVKFFLLIGVHYTTNEYPINDPSDTTRNYRHNQVRKDQSVRKPFE